jgi:LmbE family N-acetylglucosaminyl deacetylase
VPIVPASGRPRAAGRHRFPAPSAGTPLLILVAVALAGSLARPAAQLRPQPVGERPDTATLTLVLRQLDSIGTFMQTDAHPDDEDNALLAMMGHGEGLRTVLVSATRGDGGQNEIGPELFQALGVLRTAELEAVHRFDGAEQLFTRAVDFGYSFSVEESIERWGRDEIVGDYVRHIRATRPDVIVGFLCGGDGGGQHHQASTILTLEAFRAAADPSRYPAQLAEGLRPWQAKRVFCTQGFGARNAPQTPDLLTVDTTRFDPVLGRRYSELGIEARSMHKCQGTSQLLPLPGESASRTYQLRDSVLDPQGIAPAALFTGIDTSLAGLVAFAGSTPPGALRTGVASIQGAVTAARAALKERGPEATAEPLAAGLAAVRALRQGLASMGLADDARYEIDFRLARKEQQFQRALLLSHGMVVDVLANDGTIVRGQPLQLTIAIGNRGTTPVTLGGVEIRGLSGATATCSGTIAGSSALRCTGNGTVPADAAITGPYWHQRTDAARYDFDPGVPFGVPFTPSPFTATLSLTIAGADLSIVEPVQYRYSDVVAGEKRMELAVVPALSVRLSPDIVVVPISGGSAAVSRDVQVVATNERPSAAEASIELQLPAGWTATPGRVPVRFSHEGEEVTAHFTIAPPAGVRPGTAEVKAIARAADGSYGTGYTVVEYPHIHRRDVPAEAASPLETIDVRVAPDTSVGYIMGVGDEVPQALRQLGATVTLIDPAELASGDLSKYDVIMTGVRAYERRADLRANNGRLLDYARNGGTVIVQYNKFEFNQAQYGPYPAKVSSNRVTDETAPVEVLEPEHPVFTTPNRLGPETWAGWVQERGLYFLGDRDPRYVDLVRLEDPFPYNRGAKTGALVEARVGKGRWIYVGLGLWRQLPAGTPGAYRLMANLISLH